MSPDPLLVQSTVKQIKQEKEEESDPCTPPPEQRAVLQEDLLSQECDRPESDFLGKKKTQHGTPKLTRVSGVICANSASPY